VAIIPATTGRIGPLGRREFLCTGSMPACESNYFNSRAIRNSETAPHGEGNPINSHTPKAMGGALGALIAMNAMKIVGSTSAPAIMITINFFMLMKIEIYG
jgi:hypothetical protein